MGAGNDHLKMMRLQAYFVKAEKPHGLEREFR